MWALLLISSTSPFTSSPSSSSLRSPCCSHCPTLSTSWMSWINTLRTSAEDLGTLAENEPPAGYEPNDHFITEAYVEHTQESSSEQRFSDDFDYDDVTIGQTLLDACRRRADHSEEEGLSSSLSSASVGHAERWDPLFTSLCRALKKLRVTTLRMNRLGLSWSDKGSRFSLTVKRRFENTISRPIMTEVFKSWNDRVAKRRNLPCSSRRRMTPTRSTTSSWTIIGTKSRTSWSSCQKSQWNGRIEAISRLYIWYNCDEKNGRRSRYYLWTHWQDTEIAKWIQLYEWFERFSRCWISRCWISTQWAFARCQSTCVFPTSSNSWRTAKPFYRNAELQRRAAKHLGHVWYIGKHFWKSCSVFFSTLSAEIESMELSYITINSLITDGEEW